MQLNIVVCCKVVADLEMLNSEDWLQQNFSHARYTINSADVTGLEQALRLRDAQCVSQLTALSIGDKHSEQPLKNLFAIGYDQVMLLQTDSPDRLTFQPHITARLLADQIKQSALPDLIITGCLSDDGQNGQTPALLAEMLDWPYLSGVYSIISVAGSQQFDICCRQDNVMIELRVIPPMVISCSYSDNIRGLRIATLKDKLNANKKQLQQIKLEKISVPQTVQLSYQPTVRASMIIEADTPEQKAQQLYQHHIATRIGS